MNVSFTHRNNTEEGNQSAATSFHRIFVYDPELSQFIENNLKKRDRVLLTGKIGHMTTTFEDGKKMYSGFVVPDNIYRIAPRASSDDVASNETTQLNSEIN